MATLLCLPSPACSDPCKLGVKVGRRRVDIYGDNVVSEPVAGDGYRKRHDFVKGKLFSLLKWASIDSTCEVFNLFAGLIPQEGLNRLERGRKRQGMMADFKVRVAKEGGAVEAESVLAELKVISSCPTRYPRAPRKRDKAVKRRADLLPAEYARHAKKIDTEYGGVPKEVMGPVARKLASFPRLRGWVFGNWAEASPDVHTLIYDLVDSRIKHEQELEGNRGRERRSTMTLAAAKASLTGQIRRNLSLTVVKSQARLLLDRVEVLGSGGVEAARRRKWIALEGWRLAKEQRAHMLSLRQGSPVLKRGEFFLQ